MIDELKLTNILANVAQNGSYLDSGQLVMDGGVIDKAKKDIEALITKAVVEARIEALEWALNDLNMSDTDTKANLEEYIKELKDE